MKVYTLPVIGSWSRSPRSRGSTPIAARSATTDMPGEPLPEAPELAQEGDYMTFLTRVTLPSGVLLVLLVAGAIVAGWFLPLPK